MTKPLLLLTAGTLLALSGCKKVPPPAAVVAQPKLPDIPLAARMPADVDGCFCSVNLRSHLEALRQTQVWQDVSAFAEEKMPPGTALPDWSGVDDVAIAAGTGTAKLMVVLRELGSLYNEAMYRKMLQLTLGGGGVDHTVLDLALADAAVLLLERVEVPPVMIALRGEKASDVLNQLTDTLQKAPWFANAPVATVTTTQKEQLGITEVDVSTIWPLEARKAWLDGLSISDEALRGKLAQALEVVFGKTLVIAMGRGQGVAYFGIASKKEDIHLAESASQSVLARPEMAFLSVRESKPLLGAAFASAELLAASHDPAPMRAMVSALASVPMFQSLGPQIEAVHAAEEAMRQREFANAGAVLWWQAGLHAEMRGGVAGAALHAVMPSTRFATLLEGPQVLFGIAGQCGDGTLRAYFENWTALLHAAVTSGPLAEHPWAKMLPMIEPSLRESYAASKALWQNGLGNDSAFVLDLGGRMPLFPGLPPGGEKLPMPRIGFVNEIKARDAVSQEWARIETGLTGVLKPFSMPLPPVESFPQKNATAHFWTLPFNSEDWTLSAALDDQTLVFGTSRAQQLEIVEAAAKPEMKPGWHLRADFARLRSFLAEFARVRAQQSDDAALKNVIRWLEPLGDLRIRMQVENNEARSTLDWSMKDAVRAF
jgi:hypothetical protein